MKAAVLFGPGDLRVTDFPEPPLGEDCVKVAVAYCGVCGTDFHKYAGKGGSRPVTYPVPLGHEASGIVVDVGSKVKDFKPGDRVTVDPNWSCGHCWFCQNGKRHFCVNSRGVVKGMAEFICPPQENVYHIPDSLSLKDAALAEPLSCCLHGMDLLDVKLGDTVAIIGLGAIGQIMLQLLAHSAAANIIVIEPVEEKRRRAMEMGCTLFINPMKEDPSQAIRDAGIPNVDKVMECGGVTATAETAIRVAGKGATVVLFSVADPDAVLPLKLYEAFQKEITIRTSFINPLTTGRAIRLLSSGAIDTSAAISYVLELGELEEEIRTRRYSRLGKVVVRVSGAE